MEFWKSNDRRYHTFKSNTETEKLDSLIVFNNAFLVSKDTLDAGYNQISGQRLIGLFNEDNKSIM